MAFNDDLQLLVGEIQAILKFGGDDDLCDFAASIFKPFLGAPEPSTFDFQIQTIYDGLRYIGSAGAVDAGSGAATGLVANPNLSHLDDVADATLPWKGGTAREFRNNYAHPFPSVVANQNRVAIAIAHALKAEREIWVAMQKDVLDMAQKTLKAVASAESDSTSGGDLLKAGLTIAAAVVPLVGVEVGAADLVTAAASLGASADTFEIGGDLPIYPLVGAQSAALKVTSHISTQEAKVKTALDGIATAVNNDETSYYLQAPALVAQHGGLGEASY